MVDGTALQACRCLHCSRALYSVHVSYTPCALERARIAESLVAVQLLLH
jgi:hypothetical protein